MSHVRMNPEQVNTSQNYKNLMINLCVFLGVCASAWAVWYILKQTPKTITTTSHDFVSESVEDNNFHRQDAIIGSLGNDPDGTWIGDHAQIMVHQQSDYPWRTMRMRWHQVPGKPISVLLGIGAHQYTIRATQDWQRIYILLPSNTPATTMQVYAESQRIAQDPRYLSMFISQITITRLPSVPIAKWLMVLAYIIPVVCVAMSVRNRGWIGFGVFGFFTAIHLIMMYQESAVGFTYRSLWLDPYGRWLFVPIALYSVVVSPQKLLATEDSAQRILGLDVLRSVAIIGVLISHSMTLVVHLWEQNYDLYRLLYFMGNTGVNIFFALSGYLIGGILLRRLADLDHIQSIKQFWYRRWLRTLPAVYISIFVSYFFFPPNNIRNFFLNAFFIGTMNPYVKAKELGHLWSLSVEEFFYFFFPLLIYIFIKKIAPQKAFIAAAAVFIGITLINKIVWQYLLPINNLITIPKWFLWNNLDLILWGVLLAYMKLYQPKWFRYIADAGILPGMLMVIIGYAIIVDYQRWFLLRYYFGSACVTIGATLMIPGLLHVRSMGHAIVDWALRWCAKLSYSLYLYNLVAMKIAYDVVPQNNTWQSISLSIGIYVCISFILAFMSYTLIEQPVLRWRDVHVHER